MNYCMNKILTSLKKSTIQLPNMINNSTIVMSTVSQ